MQQNPAKSGTGVDLTFVAVPELDEFEDQVAGNGGVEEAGGGKQVIPGVVDVAGTVPALRAEKGPNELMESLSPGGMSI